MQRGSEVARTFPLSLPETPFSSQVPKHNHCINFSGPASPKSFLPTDCCPPSKFLSDNKALISSETELKTLLRTQLTDSDHNHLLKHLNSSVFRLQFENHHQCRLTPSQQSWSTTLKRKSLIYWYCAAEQVLELFPVQRYIHLTILMLPFSGKGLSSQGPVLPM